MRAKPLLKPATPASPTVNATAIPAALKDLDQWVLWRAEKRNGEMTKIPYALNGKPASSTDPSTWSTFAETFAEYRLCIERPDRWSGIGFVFTENDPFVGVDLDHCRDPETGNLLSWNPKQRKPWPGRVVDLIDIIQSLGTYCEVSPSSTGIKLFCRGRLPDGKGVKRGDVEMYDRARYFTVTGCKLLGAPASVNDCQPALNDLLAMIRTEPKKIHEGNGQATTSTTEYTPRDAEVLAKLAGADNAAKARRLLDGDVSDYPSASEADMALASVIGFWASDADQIERIMRSSKLCRDKWDQHPTYLMDTITKATANGERYDWNRQSTFPLTDSGLAERLAAIHGDQVRFCHPWGKFLVWDGRRWKPDDTGAVQQFAKATARSILKEAADEADDGKRSAMVKFARQAESATRRAAMLTLARSEPGIPILPDALDNNLWLFHCENGTIDLKTGKLLPHQNKDYITKLCPVVYDPEAYANQWLQFLDSTFGGRVEIIDFLQRLMGYALTGVVSEHILPILYGRGANGKSTFVNALLQVCTF